MLVYIVLLLSNFISLRILSYCLKKLNSRPEKRRKILETLFLIEHILRTGNSRFSDDLKDEHYKIKNLFNFSFYDESRSDKGETSNYKKCNFFELFNL